MLSNYLKTVTRNLRKNIAFTLINTFGLSIALAASFLIILFVVNELSYNSSHKHKDSIYRVNSYYKSYKSYYSRTPYIMASTFKEDIPQVEKAINTRSLRNFQIKLGEENIRVTNPVATSSDVFDIFTIPLLSGSNTGKLLDDVQSMCISESLATKLFSHTNVIGKQISASFDQKEETLTIVAIFKDLPQNSTIQADCFINSWHSLALINTIFKSNNADTDWSKDFWTTWIKLTPNSTTESITPLLRNLEKKYLSENHKSYYDFQKLSDVYLNSDNVNSSEKKGDWKTIKIFLAIALLILLVAIINYIILSTAVSSKRAKEIGIRKTFGAKKNQVKYQFLMESVVLSIIVLPIAILLMLLGLPYAGQLFQTKLPIIISNIPFYLLIYISLTIIIGLISGFYTSVGLSRLNVIKVLKLEILQGRKKNYFRSSLIIFQLVIFCFFVTCAFIIQAQYGFATTKNPGFHNKNILLVNINDIQYYNAFLNDVSANSNVISASGAKSGLPMLNSMSIVLPNQKNKEQKVPTEVMIVDYGFLETMDIKLLKGRYFSKESGNDSKASCILNETAVQDLGIENPTGYQLEQYNIIGVVKDFYLHSFHSNIPPVLIACNKNYLGQIAIRYKEGTQSDVVKALHRSWDKLGSYQKFDFVTIEDVIKELYSGEKNKLNIVSIVAFFTMLIASFGLFGLSLFIAQSRTKEIGIKKVLGCSDGRIVFSFIKTNVIYVIIASIISIPITYYAMQNWLSDYAVRTDIKWWFFILSFFIASIVVISTVFIHSYKAAIANPIKSLRSE